MTTASSQLQRVATQFGIAITPDMLDLIDRRDPHDPIAAQFIPQTDELTPHPDELADPISDGQFSPVEGIVHRYPDRVLLKLLYTCAVYCRFCFRRDQLSQNQRPLTGDAFEQAIAYIVEHNDIWEVILTGGDPLLLSERRLAEIVGRLNAIPHVKVIRIHTRIPTVTPAKITPALIAALKGRAPVYILLHCNHARELTVAARAACARLVDAGIPLLSQSVLLRGINDDTESLTDLMRALVECRIKPHYLHHGDLARGTGHFRTSLRRGQDLMRGLRGRLSGLCQPAYMLDIPGGFGKVPVGPVYAVAQNGDWLIEDYQGASHQYHDSLPETIAADGGN